MAIDIIRNIKLNETGLTEVEIQSADVALELNVDLDILQGTLDNQLFLGNSVQSAQGVDASATATRLLTDTAGKLRLRLDELAGTAIAVNSGAATEGTIRAILATNDPAVTSLAIIDDWDESDRCKVNVNLNSGIAFNIGSGNLDTGTIRVAIATDDVNIVKLVTALEIIDDWDSSNNCKVDINAQTLTALKVSKDANANATGNRLWVTADQDMVAGAAINVGAGAVGATGTQRITLGSDDPAVVSLAILDNFIGTNGSTAPAGQAVAQVGGSDGSFLRTARMSTAGDLYVTLANLLAGEDATNDWRNVRTRARYSDKPTEQTSSSTVAETTALSWTDTLGWSDLEVYVAVTGANALANVKVYISPDGTDANQQNITAYQDAVEALSQTCAVGSCLLVMTFTKPPAYLKVTTTSAGTSTVKCFYRYKV